MNKFILLFLISNLSALAYTQCPMNTTEWCKSVKVANDCNVLKQCIKFVWRPSNTLTNEVPKKIVDNSPVNLTLYYETLCPDCRNFMTTQLWTAYQSVKSIMNIRIVPYGNAEESWNAEKNLWSFNCQHGDQECYGNTLHSCLLFYRPATDDHLPFVHCMESNRADSVKDAAIKCGNQLNVNLDKVFECTTSKLGNLLQHQMARETDALQPSHNYVPWVTLNGVHTEDIEKLAETDLVKLVCQTYKGTNKPDACSQY